MKNYYLESMNYNVLGDVLWQVLSTNETGDRTFKNGHEGAWTAIAFKTPQDALQAARAYLGHDRVCLNEEHTRCMVIHKDEVLESFRITTDLE
jgi:hypothetical protein